MVETAVGIAVSAKCTARVLRSANRMYLGTKAPNFSTAGGANSERVTRNSYKALGLRRWPEVRFWKITTRHALSASHAVSKPLPRRPNISLHALHSPPITPHHLNH